MSESKKSGKKASVPKTAKTAGTTKKTPTRTPQGSVEALRTLAGATDEELKGMLAIGMKCVARLAEAQEAAIGRDRALARSAYALTHIAERLGIASEKVGAAAEKVGLLVGRVVLSIEKFGTNSDRLTVATQKAGNLLDFVADILTHNQSAVRAAAGARIWETGLRAVQTVAQALGQDIPQATAEWVATAENVAVPASQGEMGGTKPVEQGPHHHKKDRRDRPQRPLKATMAEQLAAKGHAPQEPPPTE